MTKTFKKTFALSNQGEKDLTSASIACFLMNIAIMGTVGILYMFLKESIIPILEGKTPEYNLLSYFIYSAVILTVLYICIYRQYNSTFIASYKESANKRIGLAEKLKLLPLSFFGKKDLSDLTTTIMTDTAGLETAFSHFIPQLFGAVASTCIVSVSLLFFNLKMALSLIWVIPVSFLLVILTKKFQERFNLKNKAIQLVYADGIQESIDNVKDIKANNQIEGHMKMMDEKLTAFEKQAIKTEVVTGIFITAAQMVLKIGVTTSVIMGVSLVLKNEMDIFTFIVFMMVATRIFDPLNNALINLAAIYGASIKVNRMKLIENHEIQRGNKCSDYNGWDIEFDNVKFSYNEDTSVLNGVSFVAKQGEVTALVGPSGGGKSTVAKLASRFWDIDKGSISLGGIDIKQVEPEDLMKQYSIVFQDVMLFNNTVMENIRIGKKDATDEEVYAVAKAARCDVFINQMENGYQTLIGENGCTLSGGERQRLSIARALLKDAPVVLLDEATASLDIENESLIQEAISRLIKDKTVIVIAHRMRTIASADNIVVLENGKVVEQGKHSKLIDNNKLYKKMLDLQVKSKDWVLD